jgi:general secretion pathway protein C
MGRRSIVPVSVAVLATCAWLHARGFSALVGGKLAVPELRAIPEAQAAVSPLPTRGTSADPILARNPFDSATGPLIGVSRASLAPDARQGEETDDVEPCDDVRAVSIVTFADAEWSFAMLDVRGEPQPVLRRIGGIVSAIGPDRVLVARGGRRCVARMFSPVAPPSAAPPVTRGIARTGPGSFALDRSARDALIEGAGDLGRSVMVRPEKVGDDVIGLRIAALKPGTALDALGLRAGDVLESLDGIPLTAPDRMLEAYARARAEEHVRIVILRDGHEQQLDYDVR